ncbi:MAG: alkaline phosphatase family protein [Planctomycetaceae bacterium]|nr:alkaline phosphatase family protein [Planctomycetaceae bacterium]
MNWKTSFVILLWSFGFGRILLAQQDMVVSKIAFGSCANQNRPCPIWKAIADYQPELMILLGDNVYADNLDGRSVPATPERISAAYKLLLAEPNFARLKAASRLMATWDDHDYGQNDAGREWIHKEASAAAFHDFLGTPAEAPSRKQAGIYSAEVYGPPGRRVQVILLDTRYFRSDLPQAAEPLPGWRSRPYLKQSGPDAALLGEAQWAWFEEQLRVPAEFRIIGSSIQVLSDEHPFEMWANFPNERQRLYALLRKTEASGVVMLSGDRHLGEISYDLDAISYPLFDVTASGLNQAFQGWRAPEPNRKRYAALPSGNHFGTIEIAWELPVPVVSLQLRGEDGELGVQTKIPLQLLIAEPAPLPMPVGVIEAQKVFAQNVGDEVHVQFYVRGGRDLTQPPRILLNSERFIDRENNLTVVIQTAALAGPHAQTKLQRFINQTVRARGTVTLYNGRKQVEVVRPEDLEIVER